jgi:predicted ATPase/DNA-binding SARP family transcriptional activator
MSTEFRILGPLAVVADGESVPLGAPKQRALLAALVLDRNQVVSREGLIDAVWGESPPEAASRSLQVYVHGLRRALGADRIETHGTGYRLRVEPGELDLEDFERLTARARQALAAGDPAHAAEDIRAALALWTGSPLADLAGEPVAETHAGALEEVRLAALELRADIELARGHHAQLVPELEALVAAHPYRERLREQHVLALYRSGRQADALEAYRTARRTLSEELGIEPGPRLRHLEQRILRHDPALEAPEAKRPRTIALPAPPTPLVGRRLEVAAVTALLRGDARLITLTGPGGTGKTRLALAIADELGSELDDGAAFVDLAGVQDPSLLGPTVAETLEVPEGEGPLVDAVAGHLRSTTMLLVLDNLEQLLPGVPFVAELLARTQRLRVLATSRAALRLRAEHEYPVRPFELPDPAATFEQMAANDAVRLFAQRARAVDPTFELSDESAGHVAAICARLDGLPLAIELAASRTKLLPPQALADRVGEALDLLTGGARDLAPRQQTLRATLDWSYRTLAPDEQRLLGRLAVFAGGCSLEAVEAVCDASIESLSTLVDVNLLRRVEAGDGETRFAMLETIRDFARERLAESGEEHTYRARHCEHFIALAEHADEVLLRGPVDQALFGGLDREHDNLRGALDWAAEAGEVELEVRLTSALSHYWRIRGHLSEARRFFERALAHAEHGDPKLRAEALVRGAVFPYRQGDADEARRWWEEALSLFRRLDDAEVMTRCTAELGAVAVAEGDLERSRAFYEEAAEGFERLGHRVRLGIVKGNLAAIASMQGDLEAAARHGADAVALQEEIGDRDGLAMTLQNLARTTLLLGDARRAREHLERSLRLAHSLEYKEVIAYCLEGAAELAAADGDLEHALRFLTASEAVFGELGVPIQGEEAEGAERLLRELESTYGREAIDEARAESRDSPLDPVVEDALELLADQPTRRSPGP